jgi:hypothetical protein
VDKRVHLGTAAYPAEKITGREEKGRFVVMIDKLRILYDEIVN